MKIVKNERLIVCDVDDTLVMHNTCNLALTEAQVEDPLDRFRKVIVYRNDPMIRLLQEEIQRGSQLIVWSRGGWEWAQNVLMALKLDHLPIIVMTKPYAYFDDKDVSVWLKDRVYISPEVVYKKIK